ncbi:hypothetical protein BDW69DRAFT_118560 [Aspergillus filifer]
MESAHTRQWGYRCTRRFFHRDPVSSKLSRSSLQWMQLQADVVREWDKRRDLAPFLLVQRPASLLVVAFHGMNHTDLTNIDNCSVESNSIGRNTIKNRFCPWSRLGDPLSKSVLCSLSKTASCLVSLSLPLYTTCPLTMRHYDKDIPNITSNSMQDMQSNRSPFFSRGVRHLG